MKNELKLSQVDVVFLEPKKEPTEGKRWSYSFVYYLEDLRNIYNLFDKYDIDSIPTLFQKCVELGLMSWSGKSWNQRNLLELVNALKNFKLLSVRDNSVAVKGLFKDVQPGMPLSSEDKRVFEHVYLTYFRFVEFHRLFCNTDSGTNVKNNEQTTPVIYYMQGNRFTNRFILSTVPQLQIAGITDNHADMMRFWDVYIKWGMALNMLRKYPLKPFGISTVPSVKGLSIAYFYREIPDSFSVFDFMLSEMSGSYLYIPDIIYSLIYSKHFAVEDIKKKIVEESIEKPDVYRAQSTSAIFVNEKENFLLPKIGNTYITHLLKL